VLEHAHVRLAGAIDDRRAGRGVGAADRDVAEHVGADAAQTVPLVRVLVARLRAGAGADEVLPALRPLAGGGAGPDVVVDRVDAVHAARLDPHAAAGAR